MFITQEPILIQRLKEGVSYPDCGAVCTFEGLVRNNHKRKRVTKLIYETYRECAEKEYLNIEREVLQKYPDIKIRAKHRIGELAVGEVAVAISVWAPHRHEAFEACELMIDTIKKRIPIWKNEFYDDGTNAWIECP